MRYLCKINDFQNYFFICFEISIKKKIKIQYFIKIHKNLSSYHKVSLKEYAKFYTKNSIFKSLQ